MTIIAETRTAEEWTAELRVKHLAGCTEDGLRERLVELRESGDVDSPGNIAERLEIVLALDGFPSSGPSDAAWFRLGEVLADVDGDA